MLRPLRRWACSERLADVLLDALRVVGLVDGQLEQGLQRRQRRPQLVRGGGDEHAPRVLLLREPLLQAGEGARELAELVAAVSTSAGARIGSAASIALLRPRRRRSIRPLSAKPPISASASPASAAPAKASATTE